MVNCDQLVGSSGEVMLDDMIDDVLVMAVEG